MADATTDANVTPRTPQRKPDDIVMLLEV